MGVRESGPPKAESATFSATIDTSPSKTPPQRGGRAPHHKGVGFTTAQNYVFFHLAGARAGE